MAITHVNSSTNGNTSGTAITCSAPASIQSGDVLVCIINLNGDNAGTVSDNNGSTPFTSVLGYRAYNGDSARYYVWVRVAGSSEPATYAFTRTVNDRWSIIISAYRGVDTSTIWDVQPTASTENVDGSSPFSTLSLITVNNGAMIIACSFSDSSSVTYTATPGDSFNSRQNNSGEELIALADKVLATAGTQSAVSWTGSADVASVTQIFSLKPAVAAGTAIPVFVNQYRQRRT
jgi:hypothetical protein